MASSGCGPPQPRAIPTVPGKSPALRSPAFFRRNVPLDKRPSLRVRASLNQRLSP
jgi:hypothetical protein